MAAGASGADSMCHGVPCVAAGAAGRDAHSARAGFSAAGRVAGLSPAEARASRDTSRPSPVRAASQSRLSNSEVPAFAGEACRCAAGSWPATATVAMSAPKGRRRRASPASHGERKSHQALDVNAASKPQPASEARRSAATPGVHARNLHSGAADLTAAIKPVKKAGGSDPASPRQMPAQPFSRTASIKRADPSSSRRCRRPASLKSRGGSGRRDALKRGSGRPSSGPWFAPAAGAASACVADPAVFTGSDGRCSKGAMPAAFAACSTPASADAASHSRWSKPAAAIARISCSTCAAMPVASSPGSCPTESNR
jgi:hypothetical protein